MPSTGAFTAVTARRSFDKFVQPEPAHPVSPASNGSTSGPTSNTDRGKRDWPPSVRSYVQRSFAEENILPDVDWKEMETKLKQVISHSVAAGTLTSEDWDNLPLPQMMIQEERKHRLQLLIPPSPPGPDNLLIPTLRETNEAKSKKRKSSDLGLADEAINRTAPWIQSKSSNAFESRISYPEERSRNGLSPEKGYSKSTQILDGRKRRFENNTSGSPSVQPWRLSATQEASSKQREGPIVGRCQDLEKKYFRLTSAPNPDTVRPLHILEKTLDHLKKKWKQERNYSFICDQFKSLRQDLTVQRIKTGFTVNAYEIHARIALEKGDLGEYNQCQTQLRALYAQNLGGHPTEFVAYRILYFLHTSNRTDMNDVLADLTPTEKQDKAVKNALDTRSALALGDYHRFFQLYLDTPNMGAYLMDMFVARERLSALCAICRAYKPHVKLRFITEELGFESDDESARFICDNGAQQYLEERNTGVILLTGKALNFFDPALTAVSASPDSKAYI
ncbi:MAG: hypothetical protein LQ343_002375 [Gyalolechia ehrenbergii]|nr:MAG: hypothetical protein LQ343_002375 [Gyalolechia ehrenbergii]